MLKAGYEVYFLPHPQVYFLVRLLVLELVERLDFDWKDLAIVVKCLGLNEKSL